MKFSHDFSFSVVNITINGKQLAKARNDLLFLQKHKAFAILERRNAISYNE